MADDSSGKVLDEGKVSFQAEGRLLQELGERLVASPEVALVELIKNSYDADSAICSVTVSGGGKTLVIDDDGHGMTFDAFLNRWMRIATSNKVDERRSRKYRRQLTGAKGIGRFAVRYLGKHLTLTTIADDEKRGTRTRLTATFDWPAIDKISDLRDASIAYTLSEAVPADRTGTTLQIGGLKTSASFAGKSSLRSDVLRIVTPIQGLEGGRFKQTPTGDRKDPGFAVTLPGSAADDSTEVNLADLVLRNHWARLQIELTQQTLRYTVSFPTSTKPKVLDMKARHTISAGFVADIRYFPRRKGVFRGKGINGQSAWKWVRDNHGVSVIDHGFRVVPYGQKDDDWLHLSLDKSHSERDWRSTIAKKGFPISATVRNTPADNPALYLPYNYQLVGAVFVESKPSIRATAPQDLVPSMDREGFLRNSAFNDLTEFVRGGIEFLAHEDKKELDRILDREAKAAVDTARAEVRQAIEYINDSPTLTSTDKKRITKAYRQLADQIESAEEYNIQARRSLTVMSLLGVVAGFMTHENKSLVFEIERASDEIRALSKKHPSLRKIAEKLDRHLKAFKDQLQYVQMFVAGVRKTDRMKMSAAAQIRHVIRRFDGFVQEHGIVVVTDASADTVTPALSAAIYSGIILNLFTNAIKAVLAVSSSLPNPRIAIRSWNESGDHYLEVSDNGVGIPKGLRRRIWDPLYTTTSDSGNPLGSGMGLGLTLVKQVVEDSGGTIAVADTAPPGYSTCFRVVFPSRP